MSWEAWGDDNADDYDHLIEAGWLTDDQARELADEVERLKAENARLREAIGEYEPTPSPAQPTTTGLDVAADRLEELGRLGPASAVRALIYLIERPMGNFSGAIGMGGWYLNEASERELGAVVFKACSEYFADRSPNGRE